MQSYRQALVKTPKRPRIRVVGESEIVITNEMTDRNSDRHVRLVAVLDVLMLAAFFAAIGIMAAKVR